MTKRQTLARGFNLALMESLGLPLVRCLDFKINHAAEEVLSVTVTYALSPEDGEKMAAAVSRIDAPDVKELAAFGFTASDLKAPL